MSNQLEKLENLIRAAEACRPAASVDQVFGSRRGLALINAAFELFECDELYTLARDIERDVCGPDDSIPPLPLVETKVRKLDETLWGRVA